MKSKFNQLCVWPSTEVGKERVKEFVKFMKDEFKSRVQYVDEVILKNGRNDLFFYIHDDDINKFAVPRLSYGIRWWEDVLLNGHGKDYPKDFLKQHPKTW